MLLVGFDVDCICMVVELFDWVCSLLLLLVHNLLFVGLYIGLIDWVIVVVVGRGIIADVGVVFV